MAFVAELGQRKSSRQALSALMLRPGQEPFECAASLEGHQGRRPPHTTIRGIRRIVLCHHPPAQPPTPPVSTTPTHDNKKEGKKPVEKAYFKKKVVSPPPSLKSPVPVSTLATVTDHRHWRLGSSPPRARAASTHCVEVHTA
eukprot:PhM_4_TR1303/c2_g1_i4/m.105427